MFEHTACVVRVAAISCLILVVFNGIGKLFDDDDSTTIVQKSSSQPAVMSSVRWTAQFARDGKRYCEDVTITGDIDHTLTVSVINCASQPMRVVITNRINGLDSSRHVYPLSDRFVRAHKTTHYTKHRACLRMTIGVAVQTPDHVSIGQTYPVTFNMPSAY